MTPAAAPDPSPAPSTMPRPGQPGTSGWVAWIGFAAVMLALVGTLHVFEGIAALLNGSYFHARGAHLVVHLDLTAWGWVHIGVGIVLLVTAVGVFGGWVWARALGTVVALLSAIINVTFLAAQPVWSATMVALCIVVVLALTVHGGEIRPGPRS